MRAMWKDVMSDGRHICPRYCIRITVFITGARGRKVFSQKIASLTASVMSPARVEAPPVTPHPAGNRLTVRQNTQPCLSTFLVSGQYLTSDLLSKEVIVLWLVNLIFIIIAFRRGSICSSSLGIFYHLFFSGWGMMSLHLTSTLWSCRGNKSCKDSLKWVALASRWMPPLCMSGQHLHPVKVTWSTTFKMSRSDCWSVDLTFSFSFCYAEIKHLGH